VSARNPLPACLSHLAQGRGWQPIETAPGPAHEKAVLLWFPDDDSVWAARAQYSGGWCGMCDLGLKRDSVCERRSPTHWMPLPDPPS
jgi:hypothetical protein